MALKRLCKAAGCNRIAEYPNRYCDVHKALENPEKGTFMGGNYNFPTDYNHLYHSLRWKEASKNFLRTYDTCCRCGNRATVVDHIIPHRGDEALFWDESNWQPLCDKCHQLKTLEEFRERQKQKAKEYQKNKRIGKLWY